MLTDLERLGVVADRLSAVLDKETKDVASLEALVVSVPEDPTVDISGFQGFISQCHDRYTEVSQRARIAERIVGTAVSLNLQASFLWKDAWDRAFQDEEVAKARPLECRKALAELRRQSETCLYRRTEILLKDAQSYQKSVLETYSYLKRTLSTIACKVGVLKRQLQLGLSEGEINFGSGPD